ncbi:MAG: 16S rRNA processing protein RimM [Armatimonadetes bacterium JP3_11]|nr:MAG: 16S rRNA processing protein RimM [Armatimonadetes bacterium JP3_11]RMH09937.1 MAG: 16S rRNA processing protein RimM [Armatimonadota bacterium]
MSKPYVPKIARRWVTVGVVMRPFGIRGELKVRLETDFPERFQPGARLYWWLPPRPETPSTDEAPPPRGKKPPRTMRPQECFVKSARWHGDHLVLTLEGVETRDQAERLRGAWLMIPPEERMPLEEGQYYIDDLIGMEVFTETGERVGKLKNVRQGAAYDFYDIGAYTLPAVEEYILEVDVPNRRMVVRLPEID